MSGAEFFFERLIFHAGQARTAVSAGELEWSYGELLGLASGVARMLEQRGVTPGSRVMLNLPNGPEFIIAYLACFLGGYTAVPVNRDLPDADRRYIREVSRPQAVIDDPATISGCRPQPPFFARRGGLFAIFFTSGTTARPKGVCHTADKMTANARAFNELSGLGPDLRMLHVMPMGYMAGCLNTVLCPLAAGGTVVLAPKFSAQAAMHFWKYAMAGRVNAMWITPTAAALLARMNRSIETAEWARSNLKYVFCGTAALPANVKSEFERVFGAECLESYGMSEVQFMSCSLPGQSLAGSAGTLLKGVVVETRDEGRQGDAHLFVKSDYALEGYLDPETSLPVSPLEEELFDTGDYGRVDDRNRLFITGRAKDLIIHGGVNVSPRAIEELLCSFPGVREAAVVGRRHEFWGEEAVAFVVGEDKTEATKRSLIEYCKKHLGSDAVPAAVYFADSLPRSSLGKVQKNELRGLCDDPGL